MVNVNYVIYIVLLVLATLHVQHAGKDMLYSIIIAMVYFIYLNIKINTFFPHSLRTILERRIRK